MKICIWILLLIAGTFPLFSQTSVKPEVGKRFPDFRFNKVHNYRKKDMSLNDFDGKWLIIDFWTLTCRSSMDGFHVIKELQAEFRSDLQFVLVGKKDDDFNINIEKIYETISTNMGLDVPYAFDSLLIKKWNITAFPCLYIIDPDGILRYVTDGRDLSSFKIKKLTKGDPVTFFPGIPDYDKPTFNPGRLFGTDKLIYASLITKSRGEQQYTGLDIDSFIDSQKRDNDVGWTFASMPLYALYNYAYVGKWTWTRYDTAYYGKVNAYPILEMDDSSAFQFDYTVDPPKRTYNCYLNVSASPLDARHVMEELQLMLKKAFGYNASFEKREMPVWKLRAKPWTGKMIESKEDKRYMSPGSAAGGFVLRKQPMREFMRLLTAHLPNERRLPYIDDTGIKHDIDIRIEADMTDPNDVQRALRKYGLYLQPDTKPMKVLLIRSR